MTIQMAVLIDTIKVLSSDLCRCFCNIFSAKDYTVAIIAYYEYAAVFSLKGMSLEEYCECILHALIYPEGGGKGFRPDLVVDYGYDINLLINDGKKVEDLFLKYVTIPKPIFRGNIEFKIVQTII